MCIGVNTVRFCVCVTGFIAYARISYNHRITHAHTDLMWSENTHDRLCVRLRRKILSVRE